MNNLPPQPWGTPDPADSDPQTTMPMSGGSIPPAGPLPGAPGSFDQLPPPPYVAPPAPSGGRGKGVVIAVVVLVLLAVVGVGGFFAFRTLTDDDDSSSEGDGDRKTLGKLISPKDAPYAVRLPANMKEAAVESPGQARSADIRLIPAQAKASDDSEIEIGVVGDEEIAGKSLSELKTTLDAQVNQAKTQLNGEGTVKEATLDGHKALLLSLDSKPGRPSPTEPRGTASPTSTADDDELAAEEEVHVRVYFVVTKKGDIVGVSCQWGAAGDKVMRSACADAADSLRIKD